LKCKSNYENAIWNSRVDTVIYCQTNSPWISSCLYFHKVEKPFNGGIFEKVMESDDGQSWYGKGIYKEVNNKVILYSFNLIRSINNSVKDSMIIPKLTFIKKSDSLIDSKVIEKGQIIFVRRNK
jgi:hypothetical protein